MQTLKFSLTQRSNKATVTFEGCFSGNSDNDIRAIIDSCLKSSSKSLNVSKIKTNFELTITITSPDSTLLIDASMNQQLSFEYMHKNDVLSCVLTNVLVTSGGGPYSSGCTIEFSPIPLCDLKISEL